MADGERGCAVPVSSSRGPTYVPSSAPDSPCGTPGQPWIVDAEPGQRLDVSVVDFAAARDAAAAAAAERGADGRPRPAPCPGHLLDGGDEAGGVGRPRNVSLCPDGGRQRQRHVYRSVGHVIELVTSGYQDIAASEPDEQAAAAFLVRLDGQQ